MGQVRLVVLLLGAVFAGCTSEVADDQAEVACDDPAYGNGTCDLDLSCGIVDKDCLVPFATPEAAKTWYEAQPAAAVKGPAMPVSDPRFVPLQALIDEGWQTYQTVYDVGDLASERVQLVLVDNDTVNAFALGDSDRVRAGLAMMVHRGLIDLNVPKEQLLGTIMHELQHALALHVNPVVMDRMIKFYKASPSAEPIGNAQAEDPNVRAAFETWKGYTSIGGYMSDAELGGFPLSSVDLSQKAQFGLFGVYFYKLVTDRKAQNPTAPCTTAYNNFLTFSNKLFSYRSPLDLGYTVPTSDGTTLVNTITAVRDNCFVGVSGDAVAHLAQLMGIPDAQLRSALPPELLAEVTGKDVITGWYNIILAARKKMRELEAAFATQFGVPWSSVRYFAREEAADDTSALIMKKMGLAPDGAGQMLIASEGAATQCSPILAAGTTPPYGEYLTEDHHSTCWRMSHMRAIAANTSGRLLPSWTPLGPASHHSELMRLAEAPLPEVAR